ncbi:hypothetical protein [Pyrobaculum sp.]|uniref:hypothetical protein n=1 Tax=Pyrobaculum sp. TaxID=2004705 RepID=UPI003D0B6ECC
MEGREISARPSVARAPCIGVVAVRQHLVPVRTVSVKPAETVVKAEEVVVAISSADVLVFAIADLESTDGCPTA